MFTLPAAAVDALRVERDTLRDPRVTALAPAELAEIAVERDGLEPLHLERKGPAWAFRDEDVKYSLSQEAAAQVVAAVTADAAAFRTLPDEETTQPPLATVTLTARTGGTLDVLLLRGETDDGRRYLVQRAGEAPLAYEVDKARLTPLLQPRIALRDRTVADLRQGVEQVRLDRPDGSYTLRRNGDPWTLEKVDNPEAPAVDALVKALSPLRAATWQADRPAEAPLTLTLVPAEGEPRILRINPEARLGFVEGEEATLGAFVLSDADVDRLTAELRDRTLIPLSLQEITRVRFAESDAVIERRPDGTYVDGAGELMDPMAGSELFSTLAGLRVARWSLEPAVAVESGLTRKLEFWTTQSDEPQTLWLPLNPTAPGAFNGRTFLLDPATLETLRPLNASNPP